MHPNICPLRCLTSRSGSRWQHGPRPERPVPIAQAPKRRPFFRLATAGLAQVTMQSRLFTLFLIAILLASRTALIEWHVAAG